MKTFGEVRLFGDFISFPAVMYGERGNYGECRMAVLADSIVAIAAPLSMPEPPTQYDRCQVTVKSCNTKQNGEAEFSVCAIHYADIMEALEHWSLRHLHRPQSESRQ